MSKKSSNINLDKAINNLATSVMFKTISYPDSNKVDYTIYDEFLSFLEKAYPNIHKTCSKNMVNNYSPVYHWQGKDKSLKPILLIAHYDVVPVEEVTLTDWEVDPFAGVIRDDYVWGRGTLDNKNQVISVMEAVEHLIERNFVPNRDIYMAFGYDEEVGGNRGALKVSEYFQEKGIEFDCVLDEGGAIIEDMMEGLDKTAALVGLAEKGTTNIRINVKGHGGHSSMPPASTAIETLSKIISNVNKSPMPARLTPPVKGMFTAMAPHMKGMSFPLKNAEMLFPIIKKVLSKSPTTNALIRTTIAFTMVGGGDAANVLPQNAWATANLRILQGDSVDSTIDHIRRVNPGIEMEIEKLLVSEPSATSNTDVKAYEILTETIKEIYPDVLILPYLMAGGTDSRKYYNVCNNIYRFMALHLSQADFDTIHSNNERISFDNLENMINFYIKFIEKY